MSRWYRVFGSRDDEPAAAALLAELRRLGVTAPVRFHGDDQGWFRAVIHEPGGSPIGEMERYRADEEGIRAELNTWAAWIETTPPGPVQEALMQQVVTARQVFTLLPMSDEELDQDWEAVCQFLARVTEGVYQIDGRGFFAGNGSLLIAE